MTRNLLEDLEAEVLVYAILGGLKVARGAKAGWRGAKLLHHHAATVVKEASPLFGRVALGLTLAGLTPLEWAGGVLRRARRVVRR